MPHAPCVMLGLQKEIEVMCFSIVDNAKERGTAHMGILCAAMAIQLW